MNREMQKTATILLVSLLLIGSGYYFFKKNIGTVNIPPSSRPDTDAAKEVSYLKPPPGFRMSLFAEDVPGARVMEFDNKGRMLVSETEEGKILALGDTNRDAVADSRKILADGLNKPHGLAMHCGGGAESEGCFLYVAERDMLSRFPYDSETPSLGKKENLMRISSSGLDRHFTRSLLFLPSGSGFPMDDTLLVSVGSSCNVCHEQHPDYAAVLAYSLVDKQKEVYAKGLRNATFMTLNPVNGKVFATEMGRDNLGDNLPPDEINIIENRDNQPQNYGWPNCYGKNVHDDQFDHNTYIRNPCMLPFETPSFVDLPAHSAPLGLAFIPEEGWPPEYWYNLLVAYHGSWNRSVPTGYKIVRLKMDAKGKYLGTEDFITGWLTDGGKKLGRPVDIKVLPGGVAYISDDSTGVIYRLSQTNSGMDMGTR